MRIPFCTSSFPLSRILVFILLLTCMGSPSLAQGPGGGPGEGGPPPPPPAGTEPTAVPIDGGAGWLLAAGAGYGLKKLRQRRNSTSPVSGDQLQQA